MDLSVFPDSVCSCATCVAMCKQRNCWPLPAEAHALIDAEYGDRLMLDFWYGGAETVENVLILCPALIDYEGQRAPFNPLGRCTMLNTADLCDLHALDLKPFEGRKSIHGNTSDSGATMHEGVMLAWNNPEAQALAITWAETHGIAPEPEEPGFEDVFSMLFGGSLFGGFGDDNEDDDADDDADMPSTPTTDADGAT